MTFILSSVQQKWCTLPYKVIKKVGGDEVKIKYINVRLWIPIYIILALMYVDESIPIETGTMKSDFFEDGKVVPCLHP